MRGFHRGFAAVPASLRKPACAWPECTSEQVPVLVNRASLHLVRDLANASDSNQGRQLLNRDRRARLVRATFYLGTSLRTGRLPDPKTKGKAYDPHGPAQSREYPSSPTPQGWSA